MEQRSRGRLFEEVTPSPEDVARARALPLLTACPRRYCWWWQSLAFDWDTPVAEGCRFLTAPKSPGWQFADVPCSRCVPGSGIDHYEPREPHLEADGFHRYRFCGPQHNIPDGQRPEAEPGAAVDGPAKPGPPLSCVVRPRRALSMSDRIATCQRSLALVVLLLGVGWLAGSGARADQPTGLEPQLPRSRANLSTAFYHPGKSRVMVGTRAGQLTVFEVQSGKILELVQNGVIGSLSG